MDGITKPMLDALESTAWGMKHFGSIMTNRQLPLSVMRKCVEAGLCSCIGMATPCDDDGFLEHNKRERLGYVLTEKGRDALDEHYKTLSLLTGGNP